MRSDAFGKIYPAVELAFFIAVMLITAFVLHPVITGISLLSACAYAVILAKYARIPSVTPCAAASFPRAEVMYSYSSTEVMKPTSTSAAGNFGLRHMASICCSVPR